jgi:predicted nuclease with TOPRIM domain
MLQATYPLLFPLLEDKPEQGFMWEREWRHPSPDGFSFSHRDIQIICCPEDEEEEIRQILGEVAEDIQFIRAWQEYDDVTDYLRRQEPIWREKSETIQESPNKKEKIQQIGELIQQYHIVANSLDSYRSVVSQLSEYQTRINDEKEKLIEKISALEAQVKSMEEDKEG